MSSGECQTKNTKNYEEDGEDNKPIIALDEGAPIVCAPNLNF